MKLLACVSVAVCVSLLLLGRSGAGAIKCGKDEVQCGDSEQCVGTGSLCNGHAWCDNGWDELHCTTCEPKSFLCDGSRCVHDFNKCDGVTWCKDGTDEANCSTIDRAPHKEGKRCNGKREAWTKDDELNCTPDMCQAPATSSTYCDGRCLNASSWCDGKPDCADGKDEAKCN